MIVISCYSLMDQLVVQMSCTAHSDSHDAHLIWRGQMESDLSLYDALDAVAEACAAARRDLDSGAAWESDECAIASSWPSRAPQVS